MPSVIDICNLALSHLGDTGTVASIDPPEGSAQAEHCARFYPIARDALLELHPWNFAMRRATLAMLDVPVWSWCYAYAAPSNAIRILALLPPDADKDAASEPFEVEAGTDGSTVIRANLPEATVRYMVRVEDPTRFSPLFVEALTRLLASYLAGPVVKGEAGRKAGLEQMQLFQQMAAQARVSDANQRQIVRDPVAPWILSR